MRTKIVLIMGWAAAGLMAATMGGCGPSYPNCDNDDDCHEGEFCVNGLCQQCRDNSDCPAGQQCAAGACEAIPGYCNSAADCPAGQECRNNRCTAATQSFQSQETPDTGSCQLQPIYFGFDQDSLDGAARSSVQTNVDCLRSRGAAAVHVTGYTDPRGTEEYNLALGDRRSRSVADYMRSLGVGEVTQSSMGEEMASGSDEEGWRRDRRVEFLPR